MKKTKIPFLILFFMMAFCASVSTLAIAQDIEPAALILLTQESHLNKTELEIWNSPRFQKQFTESYIAETEIEPRVTEDERKRMQKILTLMSDDKLDDAVRLLERNRGEAASAVFDFTLANIHFKREELDQATEVYLAAVEKYPKFRRAWRNLGLIYVRQNKFKESLPALTKVIELGGGDALTYGLLGYSYSNAGNNISAESAYRMAIMLDPKTVDWKMGLARSFFEQSRYADAAALCKTLIVEYPDRADLWLLQANAYIGLEQPLKAAENYELVDQLGKSTKATLNMLGDIYINQEIYDLAVNYYIRAMEMNPDKKPERSVRAAKVMMVRGALSETKKLLASIESLHSDSLDEEGKKEILKLRARLAVAEGAGDEEVRVLEQIVELDPLDGEALILLGQHSKRIGETEKATFYYERAASIEFFEADAKVRHAQLLVSTGKYNEALPFLRRAQQLKPRENIQKYLEQVERVAKSR
ncbi:MAG: tetratricopeptide repeat protein [Planctomycetes bacterium]|nr:tetratricopeptide repeat protein [Planctomycetota bacterium]